MTVYHITRPLDTRPLYPVFTLHFRSWKEYSEYVGYPERTCQRYAVKEEDYKTFCGRFVTCPASADQFKKELDSGQRGNRPKKVSFDQS